MCHIKYFVFLSIPSELIAFSLHILQDRLAKIAAKRSYFRYTFLESFLQLSKTSFLKSLKHKIDKHALQFLHEKKEFDKFREFYYITNRLSGHKYYPLQIHLYFDELFQH